MTRMLFARALLGVLTLVASLVLVFVIVRVIPSDPAAILLRDDATPEQVDQVRHLWGLDRPILEQFGIYVANLLHGDAGDSYQFQRTAGVAGTSAFGLVTERMPATIELALTALLLSIAVGLPLGVLAALKADS